MSDRDKIQITFLGGASGIGASCMRLKVGDQSILVDCGIRFSPINPLPDLDQLSGETLDAVVVTHGHSDHTGALPLLHEAFPSVPIYMTSPTKDLVSILQRDALKLMNLADREFEIPLYSQKQVDGMLERVITVRHGQRFALNGIVVTFLPAGHILGASMIHMETPGGNILFTGDYSVSGQATVPNLKRTGLHVDCLVTESTYGARLHSDRKLAEKRMVQQISNVLAGGGKVLIPAFAIGRAQEVILILKHAMRRKQLPVVPVYVDGMIRSVCDCYRQHESYVSQQLMRSILKNPHPFYDDVIQPVTKPNDRSRILTGEPCVIISSSGMLQGGPSAFYALSLAENELNAILITGYQDEEAPGRMLQNLTESGDKHIVLGGRSIDVACKCETYSLSAHADRLQISGLIESLHPRSVILVHGDHESRETLGQCLAFGDTVIPEDGDSLERSYPIRRTTRRKAASTCAMMTEQAARTLVGPATGRPVSLMNMSITWFGHQPTGDETERLLNQLLEYRLIRRDPDDQNLLWPLTPPALTAMPGIEDIEREKRLKTENPFGVLLEFIQRRNLPKPRLLSARHRSQFTVELQVTMDGETISSGLEHGHTENMAKQMAAESLIECLTRKLITTAVIEVEDAHAEQMKDKNFKGQLLELCQSIALGLPALHSEAVPGGFIGWGSAGPQGPEGIRTGTYFATSQKTVEHAVSRELLSGIREAMSRMKGGYDSGESGCGLTKHAKVGIGTDPRILLNEMKQKREINNFGYEEVARSGPSHSPVFTLRGWFQLPGRDRCYCEPATAANKKDAQKQCAEMLLEAVQKEALRL